MSKITQETKGNIVLIISASYYPNTGPGVERVFHFAAALKNAGYMPLVLASDHGNGRLQARWFVIENPLDKEGLLKNVQLTDRRRRQSAVNQLTNVVVPAEPNLMLSIKRAVMAAIRNLRETGPSLIYSSAPPYANLVIAEAISKHFGCPLIVDFRDPWSTNPMRIWPTRFHFFREEHMEQRILQHAAAVIVNTPQARRDMRQKYPDLQDHKVHVISHGYDQRRRPPRDAVQLNGEKGYLIRIGYAGGFYESRVCGRKGLLGRIRSALAYNPRSDLWKLGDISSTPDTIFRAIGEFNSKHPPGMSVSMEFIGGDPSYLEPRARRHGVVEFVRVLPRIRSDEVPHALAGYDLLYLTNVPVEASPFVASKTFDYLSTGVPIIANLPTGDNACLIEETGAGWVFRPNDHQSIVTLLGGMFDRKMVLRPVLPLKSTIIDAFKRQNQLNDFINVVDQVLLGKDARKVVSEGYRMLGESV